MTAGHRSPPYPTLDSEPNSLQTVDGDRNVLLLEKTDSFFCILETAPIHPIIRVSQYKQRTCVKQSGTALRLWG